MEEQKKLPKFGSLLRVMQKKRQLLVIRMHAARPPRFGLVKPGKVEVAGEHSCHCMQIVSLRSKARKRRFRIPFRRCESLGRKCVNETFPAAQLAGRAIWGGDILAKFLHLNSIVGAGIARTIFVA